MNGPYFFNLDSDVFILHMLLSPTGIYNIRDRLYRSPRQLVATRICAATEYPRSGHGRQNLRHQIPR